MQNACEEADVDQTESLEEKKTKQKQEALCELEKESFGLK